MPTRHGGSLAKNASTSPRRSLRLSTARPAASTPCTWNTFLIVCSQSTKRPALALRTDGHCIADLDGVTGDDHAVDEQLQQLSLSPEVRLLQALSHALAERLGMRREASGFGLAVGVAHEFAFLAIECDQPALRVLPAAPVLA